MSGNNIILTGIPRSGTTLTTYLLNTLPNTVALAEPIDPYRYVEYSRKEILNDIFNFFADSRQYILKTGQAPSCIVNGNLPYNFVSDSCDESNKRAYQAVKGSFSIAKSLTDDFKLIIKQPNLFTGLLAQLSKTYECYAVIRNPLSVLLSWNSVSMPVSHGRAPVAEYLDSTLKARLIQKNLVYERQLILLDWYYAAYCNYLPNSQVIFYEDIIASDGKALEVFGLNSCFMSTKVISQELHREYDKSSIEFFKELLLGHDSAYWKFYSKNDITSY